MPKLIELDYPNDRKINHGYDGKSHKILPLQLKMVIERGKELFLLTYWDKSFGKLMVTLLVKENGQLVKVPLIKYDKDFDKLVDIFTVRGIEVNLEKLPNSIKTKPYPVDLLAFLEEPQFAYGDKEDEKASVAYASAGAPPVPPKPSNLTIIPIYYNSDDGRYYYDEQGKNLITDDSIFPKHPKEGDLIWVGPNLAYQVHYVVRVRYKYSDPPEYVIPLTSSKTDFEDVNINTITIYYNLADEKYYYDLECTRLVEDTRAFPKHPHDGEQIMSYYPDRKNISIEIVFVKRNDFDNNGGNSYIQPVYYDENTGNFYIDRECTQPLDHVLQLDMYLMNSNPNNGDLVEVASNLSLEINVVTKNKTRK